MRYKCTLMYDGTNFHGFQIQDDLRTVQLEIENVLKIITKENTKIYAAGRTDTHVHALGQVFHFDTDIIMKEWQMKNAINSRLPSDVYVKEVEIVDDNFHSRFSAHEKTYRYIINNDEFPSALDRYREFHIPYPLDVAKMKEALSFFEGEHDFKGFMSSGGNKKKTTVRLLTKCELYHKEIIM